MERGPRKTKGRTFISLAVLLTGSLAVSGLLPSCETALTTFNPCGSIFGFCEPQDIDLMFADIPDYDLDPSCTIPYFGINNPDAPGGGGGAGAQGNCATSPVYPFTPGARP